MTDVLIIGNGAAGLAAAITLRQKQLDATIVHRPAHNAPARVGESLAASARGSLQELGVWDVFRQTGHQPCYGNASCWGSPNLHCYDFIQSVSGNGWYIDRHRFQEMLRCKAVESGVPFIPAERSLQLLQLNDGSWEYKEGDQWKTARRVIDASGRNSWLSRQLGITRIRDDQQVAVISLLEAPDPVSSTQSLVEAVSDGWWYVSDAGRGRAVCIFFTDPDLHDRTDWQDPGYWAQKRMQTSFVKHRVAAGRYTYVQPPHYTAAGSHCLERFAGQGWFVAGDAACAFDPLSSHGIAFALRSGIDAGLAAAECLAGMPTAADSYDQKLRWAMQTQEAQRVQIYRQESRWADQRYWQRRHGLHMADIAS